MTGVVVPSEDEVGVATAEHRERPERRGVLDVRERAVERLVEGVLGREVAGVTRRSVSVRAMRPDGVDLAAAIAMAYPTTSLADELAEVRRIVGDRVGRLLGRPVRRLDLTVTELQVGDRPDRPRVV